MFGLVDSQFALGAYATVFATIAVIPISYYTARAQSRAKKIEGEGSMIQIGQTSLKDALAERKEQIDELRAEAITRDGQLDELTGQVRDLQERLTASVKMCERLTSTIERNEAECQRRLRLQDDEIAMLKEGHRE